MPLYTCIKPFITYHLAGLLFIHCVNCLPREIKIGGLFSNEESTTENAFKYAVYRIKHEKNLLGGSTLSYDARRLSVEDAFTSSMEICDQITLGISTLFGPRSQDLSAFTNTMCSHLHIPHIEYRETTLAQTLLSGFSINIHPKSDHLSKAYIDLIHSYKMKTVLLIYENQGGLIKMQTILHEITKDVTRNVFIRQGDRTNVRDVLKEAKSKSWTNIIVDMNISNTAVLLRTALQEGMIDPYHHYVLTTLDIEGINLYDYKYNYVNLTGFRLVDPNDEYTRDIIKEMYYYERDTNLKLLYDKDYSTIPYESALIFDAVLLFAKAITDLSKDKIFIPPNVSCDVEEVWRSGKDLYNYLQKSEIRGLTGDIKIRNGRRQTFKLDVMQLTEEGLRKVGIWNSNTKTGVNFTHRYIKDNFPFGNKTLVVTTKLDKPYVMKKALEPGVDGSKLGNDLYEGFCIDLLKEMAAIVGFEYKIVPVEDGLYGMLNDGEWNGIVRELIDRKADLAVAALTISYLREQYIDFTKPFLNLGISILFKTPERKKPGLFSFLNPLALEIWVYVVAAYMLVSFCIFVLARFSPYEWYNPHPCNPDTDTVQNTFDLSNSFWFSVGTLMQQGSDVNPRAISTRIVGATWWFFTLIIISSYTANLAAFLTVERMISPIESAEGLAAQNKIKYGTLEGGSTMTFFRDSKIDTYRRMWHFMRTNPDMFVKDANEGVAKVKAGNYAYLMESTSIEYEVQQNCDLMQVGGLLDSKGFGVATPMGSPLRDKLSLAILHLQEDGKVQELYNKWWKGSGKCMSERKAIESKANALDVNNVGGIFVVLLGGLAVAVIVAFLEFIWKSKKNAREDRQSLCSEMIQELKFAVRCHGSSKKSKTKRRCAKCKKGHNASCPLSVDMPKDSSSSNGILPLRELRKSPVSRGREFSFGEGAYMHVEYSDAET
ncbi:glutamate receptor ionotropic, kainate 2-like isoform X2 [Saccostrea echinata]|uniref:glutamate receptor ionotropic, kainate 2-like isoform X2 n=1 Tax=Saccostrea echinata TaxID=191078 RepID=UPI002A8167AE|nr:glutamate receptor ionotropic, kainate 2-like isoform X2 [Saccostrea echinata]